MNQPLHHVLAIGDADHSEFATVLATVRDTPGARVLEQVNPRQPCELVLVLQARSGSVDPAPLETLHHQMPLAGKAVVLGTWCEGEARTGRPLVDYERVFWYHFPAWWQAVRAAWAANRPTHWQQPPDVPAPAKPLAGRRIAVDTEDADAATALVAAGESLGATTIWHPRWRSRPLHSPVDAAVWVGAQLDDAEQQQLADYRSHLGADVPLLVLLDFPRTEVVRRAEQLGATSVLGKPWRLESLAAALAM